MRTRNGQSRICLALALATSIVGLLGVVAWSPPMAQAAPSHLPPRPTRQPQVQPGSPQAPSGGFIELRVSFTPQGLQAVAHWQELWTVVQWQDRAGAWHDVTGWQGTLDEANPTEGQKVWWVADEDLGTGPFHWVLYHGRAGRELACSEPFDLPGAVGETVRVQVLLSTP